MNTEPNIVSARVVPLGLHGLETTRAPRAFDVELTFETGLVARMHVHITVRRVADAFLEKVLEDAEALGRYTSRSFGLPIPAEESPCAAMH